MGQFVPSPHPIPPAYPIWEARRGQTYVVFVDETFSQFFELKERGYFCYGAVGVPERAYELIRAQSETMLARYCESVGFRAREIKHREFKRIQFTERWALAATISQVLESHGGFVCGFYTPARAFLLEHVRVNIMDDLPAIPVEHDELLAKAAAEVEKSWKGPGQSAVLEQLLALPLSSALHAMSGLDCKFRMVYDSRETKEDRAVKAAIEDLAERLPNVWEHMRGCFLGFDEDGNSETEIGLQLADLVAGETRAFLEANPDLLQHGASPRIITQASDEPFMAVEKIRGRNAKTGVVTRMPNALAQRFFRPDPRERSVFPNFANLVLAGVLSCYSSWGTPRNLMFFDKIIFDQTDK